MPSLAKLLMEYMDERNAGAWSEKAKVGNLKRASKAVSYLSEHKLHTLDDLENRLALLHTEIDEVKADLDARHARMKELHEQFKSEYESELRQFYMARRKLSGGIHIAEWRRELAMLERESNAAYAKYKAPRDELSELLDVKYCIVHALAAREAKGRVSRPLNKLQPERE